MGVDPSLGLTREKAIQRRELYGTNRLTPPVNCPSWLCCLLPCLLRTTSMQNFQNALPKESTVRRIDPHTKRMRRIRMDATSIVHGDVIELNEGDIVGADVRLVECSEDCIIDQSNLTGKENTKNLEEQDSFLLSRKKAHLECTDPNDPMRSANIALMSSYIAQGCAVGIVIATGDDTVWGQLLSIHQWPIIKSTKKKKLFI
jgi:magnesium-transporting ATPase (P-type)